MKRSPEKEAELLELMWNGAYASSGLSEAELLDLFTKVNQPYREALT